ncbi:uncharacterized protein AMSG_05700 [Thecamonas trahens ATCC 50062]|uniref:Uncharacterized protein n=1 Tax=Thecamonas trahens ATCC 50062 TaxID=461836 RepID=A0A0L0DBD0_THETB|nr:hypothetical protein AMSG_05700 [Thecamonas trahens ATCC 50062]KNC49649.1 hypothetical protein AMSG_05700 [Thecamonas trahens ATCC 50062]|eukprot:XP_013757750.1 hypothetical protein AMSG_05700 [Thecamonas trahens ATCC 50062]
MSTRAIRSLTLARGSIRVHRVAKRSMLTFGNVSNGNNFERKMRLYVAKDDLNRSESMRACAKLHRVDHIKAYYGRLQTKISVPLWESAWSPSRNGQLPGMGETVLIAGVPYKVIDVVVSQSRKNFVVTMRQMAEDSALVDGQDQTPAPVSSPPVVEVPQRPHLVADDDHALFATTPDGSQHAPSSQLRLQPSSPVATVATGATTSIANDSAASGTADAPMSRRSPRKRKQRVLDNVAPSVCKKRKTNRGRRAAPAFIWRAEQADVLRDVYNLIAVRDPNVEEERDIDDDDVTYAAELLAIACANVGCEDNEEAFKFWMRPTSRKRILNKLKRIRSSLQWKRAS